MKKRLYLLLAITVISSFVIIPLFTTSIVRADDGINTTIDLWAQDFINVWCNANANVVNYFLNGVPLGAIIEGAVRSAIPNSTYTGIVPPDREDGYNIGFGLDPNITIDSTLNEYKFLRIQSAKAIKVPKDIAVVSTDNITQEKSFVLTPNAPCKESAKNENLLECACTDNVIFVAEKMSRRIGLIVLDNTTYLAVFLDDNNIAACTMDIAKYVVYMGAGCGPWGKSDGWPDIWLREVVIRIIGFLINLMNKLTLAFVQIANRFVEQDHQIQGLQTQVQKLEGKVATLESQQSNYGSDFGELNSQITELKSQMKMLVIAGSVGFGILVVAWIALLSIVLRKRNR